MQWWDSSGANSAMSLIQHADELLPPIPNCEGARNGMSIVGAASLARSLSVLTQ